MRVAIHRLDLRMLALAGAVPLASLIVGMELVHRPTLIRLLVLALVICALFVVSVSDPRSVIVALFALLPFLGLARRLLISVSGWPAHDPLVLLGPLVAVILFARLFLLERRPLSGDRMSQLVLALLVLAVVESANPHGGGLSAGVGGFVYVGIPLLWYFVGRELIDTATMRRILWMTVALSCVVAVYGLRQYLNGFPPWDKAWLSIIAPGANYNSLYVGSQTRVFGTFPSSAEYATYLAIGMVVAFAFALRGRLAALALVPLLAVSVFLDGSRGPVVLALLALFVIVGLMTGSPRKAAATIAVGLVLAGIALHTYKTTLQSKAATTGNSLITHQVNGLSDPLNSKQSTLRIHYDELIIGVKSGFHDPFGQGTAAISLGGSNFGATNHSSEFDVSNAFVGLGVIGGLLFLWLLLKVLKDTSRLYIESREPAVLAGAAVLVVAFGQWLNGGLYTVTPLVWLVIGWFAAETRARTRNVR